MPAKRPIDTRITEAEEKLSRLKDEKRIQELQARMRNRRNRRRR